MTNRSKFTAAQLAVLDQRLAEYDPVVSEFVQQAADQVEIDGRVVGIAAIADHLANTLDEDQLASVAAIALVRLSDQRTEAKS